MQAARTDRDEREATASWRERLLHLVPSILRNAAYAGLLGGFLGAMLTGESPVAGDSIYSVAFLVGAGCGVVSIYLAMFLQQRDRR